jgi:pyruvate/2-oxoglutarate dehydrogenase complex dihydrolipoamide dehydrogenase (E3) component
MDYDLAIVGSGGGAFAAAIAARRMGLRVAMIERDTSDNVPRAIVSRNAHGLVKLVAERDSGRVLGVHLLAEGAGDAVLDVDDVRHRQNAPSAHTA